MIHNAINHYKHGITHDIFSEPVISYAQLSVEALEKQIPQKPVHIYEIYSKHDWKLDENGDIDTWAWENGKHHGPVCMRCRSPFCSHCTSHYDDTECEIDEMHCPSCNIEIDWPYELNKFCRNCGQALDWSDLL